MYSESRSKIIVGLGFSLSNSYSAVVSDAPRKQPARRNMSSAEFSCIFIHLRSPVRQAAIRTVQWPGFDALILVAIVVNCVFMALDPPYGWLVEATEVYL